MPPSGTAAPAPATEKVAAYRSDLDLYAREQLHIVTKQARLEKLNFNFAQRFVHEKVSRQMRETGAVRAIVLKARQEGVSTYVAARFYRRATMYHNQNCMVIGDQRKRGAVLFNIYETYHRYMAEDYKPKKRYASKSTQLWYDQPDGTGLNSKISVETAKDTAAGRASTIHSLHASEVAFWENAEDLWIGLSQSLPHDGSEVIIESTANGVGNFFHQMWEDAETGASGYLAIFLPWWVHEEYELQLTPAQELEISSTLTSWEEEVHSRGVEWEGELHKINLGKLAWRRKIIRDNFRGDERSFRQEYPSTAREAFLVSGNIFFDEHALAEYEASTRPPRYRANLVWSGGIILPSRTERGSLRVWEPPRQNGHYVIWADTASGKQVSERETISESESERGGRDFCSADVFDVASQSYVAQLHGRIVPEVMAEQLQLLGYFYASGKPGSKNSRLPALLAVERNHSSGETVLSILKEVLKYPRLYYHKHINRRTQKTSEVLGWVTNVENRQVMLDDFAQALRENAVSLPNADTIREAYTFIRGEDGKPQGQEGCHDDRIMSAAGVLRLARYSHLPSNKQAPEREFTSSPAGFWEG